MGRVSAAERREKGVVDTLMYFGIGEKFARSVAKTYCTISPSQALIQLYAGGWEVSTRTDNDGVMRMYIEKTMGAKGNGSKKSKKRKN